MSMSMMEGGGEDGGWSVSMRIWRRMDDDEYEYEYGGLV